MSKFDLEGSVYNYIKYHIENTSLFTDKFRLYQMFLALIWLFYEKYKEK